ncbi:PadR family transcriptional regulator [Streptomyces clavuligerus]|uniref:Putative PadR-like family transcriptional regulator n=1 Tax=Streptomyces clavuligerus TaxID=1901 RepID=E2PU60_STRCL|nr:PadR family transcriptional regulator [Streptomyces clavuligerus]AXU15837.1 PadR family transcriptional regulator [Streptomyces clavuligerus]EFG05679.1 Putative PadR-like family transcriptional regulator [Streptomyces clavuligerus]MBY6305960.1 helix-turn-helix transcriptional regulator [Streptomyces clavuligerus]QCS08618.1 PadR family transcriptional regulator [Streptomyces clavuligerus]QPJ92049.1 PadR family transcriptional regulator [Streptomyces clavuligerus]
MCTHGHEQEFGRGRCGPGHGERGGFEGRRGAFGPFGPPFGGPFGGGGHGRGGGRGRARRGDVRASILALLKDRPMHGYEMIQEIGERSRGAWKPSPGSVYPTLQMLEDEGLIVSAADGGKRLFTLTDAGRQEAEAGPDAPWEEAGRTVDWDALNEVRQAGWGLMEAFGQVWKTGSPEQRTKAVEVIGEARKKLYLILADES